MPAAVKLAVHIAQMFVGDVRVNLRGHNISMAQEFLDGPQVNPLHQKIGRHRMPQCVRRRKHGYIANQLKNLRRGAKT